MFLTLRFALKWDRSKKRSLCTAFSSGSSSFKYSVNTVCFVSSAFAFSLKITKTFLKSFTLKPHLTDLPHRCKLKSLKLVTALPELFSFLRVLRFSFQRKCLQDGQSTSFSSLWFLVLPLNTNSLYYFQHSTKDEVSK